MGPLCGSPPQIGLKIFFHSIREIWVEKRENINHTYHRFLISGFKHFPPNEERVAAPRFNWWWAEIRDRKGRRPWGLLGSSPRFLPPTDFLIFLPEFFVPKIWITILSLIELTFSKLFPFYDFSRVDNVFQTQQQKVSFGDCFGLEISPAKC